MSVKMVNALTGTPMTVPDARVEEYLAAGHKLAAAPEPKKEPEKIPEEKTQRVPTKPVVKRLKRAVKK